MLDVLGQIDRGHSAGTEFMLDGIAVGQGFGEAVEIGHLAMGYGLSAISYQLSAVRGPGVGIDQ